MWKDFKKKVRGFFKGAGAWLGAVFSGKGFDEANRRAGDAYNSVAGDSLVERGAANFNRGVDTLEEQGKGLFKEVKNALFGSKEKNQAQEQIAEELARYPAQFDQERDQRAKMQKERRDRGDKARNEISNKYGLKKKETSIHSSSDLALKVPESIDKQTPSRPKDCAGTNSKGIGSSLSDTP
jgi:hypothetical protein